MALRHRLIGQAARLYWFVRRPRTLGVRAIVLDPNSHIALVRHTYTAAWYLPGGGVKKGESCEAALRRELREEIAVADGKVERLLGVYHSRRQSKDDHILVFVVRLEADTAASLRVADPMEIEEAAWFSLDALPPTVSPATARRIAEYRAAGLGLGTW